MDALFQTVARLANGTFQVARRDGHHKIRLCAECDQNAETEVLNASSRKTNKKILVEKKMVTGGMRSKTA